MDAVVPIDVNGDGRLDLAYRSLDGIRLAQSNTE